MSVQALVGANPAGSGHSGKVRARAVALVEAGWSAYATVRIMHREGTPVAQGTVRRWTDPEFDRAEIERTTRSARKRRATTRRPAMSHTEDFKLERMRELHARGVSAKAIGQVAAVWWGEELSKYQVRNRLGLES